MKKIIIYLSLIFSFTISTFSQETNPKIIDSIKIIGNQISLDIESYDGNTVKLVPQSKRSDFNIISNNEADKTTYTISNNRGNFLYFLKLKTKFKLFIPNGKDIKLEVDTVNSDISTRDFIGMLTINNTNGEIKVNDLVGELNIYNTNGVISITDTVANIELINERGRVYTTNTVGTLNVKTSYRKIVIKNADTIDSITTSYAKIYVDFNHATHDAKIVTSNHNITLVIPKQREFGFSIFGDLIKIKNEFPHTLKANLLVLGTSNGTIKIKAKK
ncbi:MAG: hypothetical protein KAH04_00440 [Psychrilyobacter sp.]|nr:hypothetical protein [Psychrilyobacter sp.]